MKMEQSINFAKYQPKDDNTKYLRLVWGGPIGHFGLIIGAAREDVRLDEFTISEYRLPINQKSFVWHDLKR